MITTILIEDALAFPIPTRALYAGVPCRIFSRSRAGWWRGGGAGYTNDESEAWLTDLDTAMQAIGVVDPSDGLVLEFVTDTPIPVPGDAGAPNTASPTPPNTEGSNHTPASTPRRAGSVSRLLAVVLPATDLLSGSEGTPHIVLVLSDYQWGDGVRKQQVSWHGPYPTQSAASDFVALLAKPPATPAPAPIEG